MTDLAYYVGVAVLQALLYCMPIVIFICVVMYFYYQRRPYKKIPARKPFIAFLPKYRVEGIEADNVKANLDKLGFKKIEDGTYVRGKIFGEFSIKYIKLKVILSDNYFQIGAGGSPIAFDTGDLWKLANSIAGRDE
ncbi:hypothetical protein [Roseibium aggregatum]|uniref:Uncharacterized protein n=1 Tax=Roseibium aggregatum TaxID=187304 RepID=A0A926S987_9HYPH|nr:hypothetical protein [Roseibium aggregatum]MBD1546444.1 hypothetical protein [Roseibium aggregatum]